MSGEDILRGQKTDFFTFIIFGLGPGVGGDRENILGGYDVGWDQEVVVVEVVKGEMEVGYKQQLNFK